MLFEWNAELENETISEQRKAEAYCVRFTTLILLISEKKVRCENIDELFKANPTLKNNLEPLYATSLNNSVTKLLSYILNARSEKSR